MMRLISNFDHENSRREPIWTEFHFCVFFNDLSGILRHIKNGVDINLRSKDGETALHIACCTGHSESIEIILMHNPSMNLREICNGRTPLAILVGFMRQRTRILKMMLDMGADPNISEKDGVTPLHILADDFTRKNTTRSLKYTITLLKNKADVNAQNLWGDTPLHLAIRSKFTEIVPILLNNGADINIENNDGLSPLQTAIYGEPKYRGPLQEIVKHIILQTYRKINVNLHVLNEVCKFKSMNIFKNKCDEELSELQSSITDETFVTYYDFLVSPTDVVAQYLRNKNILKSVMAFDRKKYIFGSRLDQVIRNALKRNQAIEIGYEFCRKVFPVILPDLCLDVILKHLSNEDLSQLKNVITF